MSGGVHQFGGRRIIHTTICNVTSGPHWHATEYEPVEGGEHGVGMGWCLSTATAWFWLIFGGRR